MHKPPERYEKVERLQRAMLATELAINKYRRQIGSVEAGMSRIVRSLEAIERRLTKPRNPA